jgi:hypothetical protein
VPLPLVFGLAARSAVVAPQKAILQVENQRMARSQLA